MSWGVVVSIATVLLTGHSGYRISVEPRNFFSTPICQDRLQGPPNLLSIGYKDSFPGAKWLGCEDNHWPPSNAEVRNECSYNSTPHVCLHGTDRENFTFYLTCQRMKRVNEPFVIIMYPGCCFTACSSWLC